MKLVSFKSLLNILWHLLCEKVQYPRLVGLSLCSGHVTWKDDICERPGFKFTNSIWRPYSTLRRREAIVRLFYGLQKGYSLWQLKPKKGTLRKQLTVNSLPSNLLKKPFFYLHLIDELIYWLKHFDSRNTYLWHSWQVLRVTGSTENPDSKIQLFGLLYVPESVRNTMTIIVSSSNCCWELLQYLSLYHAYASYWFVWIYNLIQIQKILDGLPCQPFSQNR